VVIHTGFAISVLDQDEAQQTLQLFQELDEFSAAMQASADDTVGPLSDTPSP
jgi:hydrogenase maturation factor